MQGLLCLKLLVLSQIGHYFLGGGDPSYSGPSVCVGIPSIEKEISSKWKFKRKI